MGILCNSVQRLLKEFRQHKQPSQRLKILTTNSFLCNLFKLMCFKNSLIFKLIYFT